MHWSNHWGFFFCLLFNTSVFVCIRRSLFWTSSKYFVITQGLNKTKKLGPIYSPAQAHSQCFSQRPFISYIKTYLTLLDIYWWKITKLVFYLYFPWITKKYKLETISMHLFLIVSLHLPRHTKQACKIFDPAWNTSKQRKY